MIATGPVDLREARRLSVLEQTIETGMSSFVLVGEALLEVRDSRLYRLTYPTFEAYCKGRWGFGHSHAARLMEAAQVAIALPPMGEVPTNERQARALAPVLRDHGPEAAAAVFTQAIEATNGHVTAAAITAVANPEERPIDQASNDEWIELVRVMDHIDSLTSSDASYLAATVPLRRRAATAKRLRKLGTYLGRIAWTLEGSEDSQ